MITSKTVIVTGAANGIGRGIALNFAKEGYNVVLADIDLKGCQKTSLEIEKKGGNALVVKCDVSKKSEVKNLIDKTIKKFKKLDVLVNNAGIFPYVAFDKMKESDWDKVINVNLKSIFLCSQEALKHMVENGRIINISSIASFVGFEGLTHYCASKGGINGMTRALALEVSARKITVNGVAPGAIETPGAMKTMTPEAKKQITALIPSSRFGLPEDIANAVSFLASEKSSYITGQIIVVDGGWTLR
ncbi:SDR family oxidoreductase [Patescibacteria group bacterium]|nr:SDR family oxidoreductase [Patescibacteria group bacterium]